MEQLFNLIFDLDFLKICSTIDLYGRSEFGISLRRQFARFLGAYFLNLPLFVRPKHRIENGFPMLGDWSKILEDDETTMLWIDRLAVSKVLPAKCTPKYVIFLFLDSDSFSEAADFAEKFSDFRSNVILHFSLDNSNETSKRNWLETFINEKIFNTILSRLEQLSGPEDGHRILGEFRQIQTVVRSLDSILPANFSLQFQSKLLLLLNRLTSQLPLTVPNEVALPRPPIVCLQQESIHDKEENEQCTRISLILQVLLETRRECFRAGCSQIMLQTLGALRGWCSNDAKYSRVSNQLLYFENYEETECNSIKCLETVIKTIAFLQVRDYLSRALRDYWKSGSFEKVKEAGRIMQIFLQEKERIAELEELIQEKNEVDNGLELVRFLSMCPEELEQKFFYNLRFVQEKYLLSNLQCNCSLDHKKKGLIETLELIEENLPTGVSFEGIQILINLKAKDMVSFLTKEEDLNSFASTVSSKEAKEEELKQENKDLEMIKHQVSKENAPIEEKVRSDLKLLNIESADPFETIVEENKEDDNSYIELPNGEILSLHEMLSVENSEEVFMQIATPQEPIPHLDISTSEDLSSLVPNLEVEVRRNPQITVPLNDLVSSSVCSSGNETDSNVNDDGISKLIAQKLSKEMQEKTVIKTDTSEGLSTDSDIDSLPYDVKPKPPRLQKLTQEQTNNNGSLSPARETRKKRRMKTLHIENVTQDAGSQTVNNSLEAADLLTDFKLLDLAKKTSNLNEKKEDIKVESKQVQTEQENQLNEDFCYILPQKLSTKAEWVYLHLESMVNVGNINDKAVPQLF